MNSKRFKHKETSLLRRLMRIRNSNLSRLDRKHHSTLIQAVEISETLVKWEIQHQPSKAAITLVRRLSKYVNRLESKLRKRTYRNRVTKRMVHFDRTGWFDPPPHVTRLDIERSDFHQTLVRSVTFWVQAWRCYRSSVTSLHKILRDVKLLLDEAVRDHNHKINQKIIFGSKVDRTTIMIDRKRGRFWIDETHNTAVAALQEFEEFVLREKRKKKVS